MRLADIEDLRTGAEGDGDDVGVAGEPASLSRGDGFSVVEDRGGSDTGGECGAELQEPSGFRAAFLPSQTVGLFLFGTGRVDQFGHPRRQRA
jgi:hypothetical protein